MKLNPSTLLNSLSKVTIFFIPYSWAVKIMLESVKLNFVLLESFPTYFSNIIKFFEL